MIEARQAARNYLDSIKVLLDDEEIEIVIEGEAELTDREDFEKGVVYPEPTGRSRYSIYVNRTGQSPWR